MKVLIRLVLMIQFIAIMCCKTNAQSAKTITDYATVTLDNQELRPFFQQAQKELSLREILVVVINSPNDTTVSTLYISSIMSTAQLEENRPTLIGLFDGFPVLIYLRHLSLIITPNLWTEIKGVLNKKLSVHTPNQFRTGINYEPEVQQLTLKQNKVIKHRKSLAIRLPGWKY